MTDHEADAIPYTHWMYFSDRAAAERCAAELGGLDFLCGVDFRPPLTAEELAELHSEYPALAGLPDGPHPGDWLLRAARSVEIEHDRAARDEMEAIVVRHGGFYDGGESGWLDPRNSSRPPTGRAVGARAWPLYRDARRHQRFRIFARSAT